MKEFKKYIKELQKESGFAIVPGRRKNTIKVICVESGEMYSVHPADQAIKPLKSWINKHKKVEVPTQDDFDFYQQSKQ